MATLLRWYRRPNQHRRTRWWGPPVPTREEISTRMARGISIKEIGVALGIPQFTMYAYVRQLGLARHRRRGPEPEVEEVRRAYWDEGLSLEDLGRRFGYAGNGMHRFLKRHGIPSRHPGRRSA